MQQNAQTVYEKQTKKASTLDAFFVAVFLLLFCINPAQAKNCSSSKLGSPEKAQVKWVYDGDTLLLKDKRKIRVIGIDTPEVKHHKQKSQAYAAKAREALRELLKRFNYHIILRYGAEKRDRYSRDLAHVYLPDGTNIANWLLQRGYAKSMPIPPNIALARCYKIAEQKAQQQHLRIWRYQENQIKTATTLSPRYTGYIRLEARVKQLKHYKKSLIIMLDSNSRRTLRIKIKKKNLNYFKTLNLNKLRNKTIIVTGILKSHYGKRTIYVNYPTQLQILQKKGSHSKSSKAPVKNNAMIKWSLKK